jgi:hypothetical protein
MPKTKQDRQYFHESTELNIYLYEGSMIKEVPGEATEEVAMPKGCTPSDCQKIANKWIKNFK